MAQEASTTSGVGGEVDGAKKMASVARITKENEYFKIAPPVSLQGKMSRFGAELGCCWACVDAAGALAVS